MFKTTFGKKAPVTKAFSLPSRTHQSFKDHCDIDSILRKYKSTGVLENANSKPPSYMDCSSAPSYQEAIEFVRVADQAFSALDSDLRKRFSNDPYQFLAFCENPDNFDEMVKLGLAEIRHTKGIHPKKDDIAEKDTKDGL